MGKTTIRQPQARRRRRGFGEEIQEAGVKRPAIGEHGDGGKQGPGRPAGGDADESEGSPKRKSAQPGRRLTFIFLNGAHFKGNRAGQHFGEGHRWT